LKLKPDMGESTKAATKSEALSFRIHLVTSVRWSLELSGFLVVQRYVGVSMEYTAY